MPVIVVANPKGGVGKSTISTNLAGFLAREGLSVMLGDTDRQESARTWLNLRDRSLPRIQTWEVQHDQVVKPPKGTTHVVLDTPAGLTGRRLDEVMRLADRVIVPLMPGLFDIYATRMFLEELRGCRRNPDVKLSLVANRVKEGTIASEQLQAFVDALGIPLVASLRDTQNYVHLAARGLTLWDVGPSRVERDLAQWRPLLEWVRI